MKFNFLCLFGFHKWGEKTNIREDSNNFLLLFLPFFIICMIFGLPKICDRKCLRCGKTKTFDL